uniref:Uncharacterized protein n=1 Tax=Lepeophtheirus salmonis TaxID=72036 RepID=A0A0K2U2D9_LEPSM
MIQKRTHFPFITQ